MKVKATMTCSFELVEIDDVPEEEYLASKNSTIESYQQELQKVLKDAFSGDIHVKDFAINIKELDV